MELASFQQKPIRIRETLTADGRIICDGAELAPERASYAQGTYALHLWDSVHRGLVRFIPNAKRGLP
jgi:hypothetical protein